MHNRVHLPGNQVRWYPALYQDIFILFVCPINELLYGNRVQIITQRISGIFTAIGIINGSGYSRPKVAFD